MAETLRELVVALSLDSSGENFPPKSGIPNSMFPAINLMCGFRIRGG